MTGHKLERLLIKIKYAYLNLNLRPWNLISFEIIN